jgi:hypothetical protein
MALTATFVATKQPSPEELPVGIDSRAYLFSICARTHGINVHFILGGNIFEEFFPARSGACETQIGNKGTVAHRGLM